MESSVRAEFCEICNRETEHVLKKVEPRLPVEPENPALNRCLEHIPHYDPNNMKTRWLDFWVDIDVINQ